MRRKRILVVDDEVYIVHILEFSLAMEGFEVIPATDAAEALRKVEEDVPDLIMLDTRLGDADGYELCARLRRDERLRDLPILFLHSKEEQPDPCRGGRGVVAFVAKPFSPQKLIAEIHAALACCEDTGRKAVGL